MKEGMIMLYNLYRYRTEYYQLWKEYLPEYVTREELDMNYSNGPSKETIDAWREDIWFDLFQGIKEDYPDIPVDTLTAWKSCVNTWFDTLLDRMEAIVTNDEGFDFII